LNLPSYAFVDSSPDPFVVFDRNGTILAFNAPAEEFLGHRGADLLGRAIGILFPSMGRDPVSTPGRFVLDACRPDGSRVRVEVTLTPVESGLESLFIGRVGLPPGRNGQVGAESPLAPNRVLPILSHELRTPLQAILGWVHVLRMRPGDKGSVERGLSAIERNIHQQAQVLDDLMDMTELSQGRHPLDPQRVLVRAVVEDALSQLKQDGASRDIRWNRRLPSEELEVLFDPGWLRRVILVLLGNALKFSPAGGSIDTELGKDASFLTLVVTDSNAGGDADAFYVYDEFRHGPPASTRDFGALGIGLSNVQSIVELQGGTVRAESQGFGRGATFEISLPLAR